MDHERRQYDPVSNAEPGQTWMIAIEFRQNRLVHFWSTLPEFSSGRQPLCADCRSTRSSSAGAAATGSSGV